MARTAYTRPLTNKVALPDQALEPEPREKLEEPKPEPCEDPQKVQPDYDCALDKLGKLDKIHQELWIPWKKFQVYTCKYFEFLQVSKDQPSWTSKCTFEY